jgi:hypothetical protein
MQDDMLDRFLRSSQLLKASWDVLRSDRELVVLPVLSVIATMTAMLVLVMSMRTAGVDLRAFQHRSVVLAGQNDPTIYVCIFIAYLVTYFIAFFFNTALVGAALERLKGGDPTVGSALALASHRIGPIFGYALVSATVGILMALIVERIGGILGRLLGIGFSLAWTVATFLVVPILAAEGVGPIRAIAESSALLRKTWGENLVGNVGISLAMSAISFAILIFGCASAIVAFREGYAELLPLILAGTMVLVVISALLGSALRGIYVAAVYYYAVVGEPPWSFQKSALRGTFMKKREY